MEFEEGSVLWHFVQSPWVVTQPDPETVLRVVSSAKAQKLIRRGPGEYFIVGKHPDGTEVEVRLIAGVFNFANPS